MNLLVRPKWNTIFNTQAPNAKPYIEDATLAYAHATKHT
jgi:hypothetical protein